MAGERSICTAARFTIYTAPDGIHVVDGDTSSEVGVFRSADEAFRYTITNIKDGGSIFVKRGVYNINEPIKLKTGVKVRGEGRHITILRGVRGVFEWAGQNNIELSDLLLDGIRMSGTGIHVLGDWNARVRNYTGVLRDLCIINFANGIVMNSFCEGLVENVKFDNNASSLILQDGCINNTFRSLQFFRSERGILIQKMQQVCEGNVFTDCIMVGVKRQLEVRDAHYLSFNNVIFDYGGDTVFVYIQGGTYITFRDCWFASQNINDGRVLVRPDAADIAYVSFDGCVFSFNKYYGLVIQRSGATGRRPRDIILSNCRFVGNGQRGDGGDLLIQDVDRVKVLGCDFASTEAPYNVAELGSPTDVWLIANNFAKGSGGLKLVAGANRIIENRGFVTENMGTAVIPAGQHVVRVAHGLSVVPDVILVTPATPLGSRTYWVTPVTPAEFMISLSAPDRMEHRFHWYAARRK